LYQVFQKTDELISQLIGILMTYWELFFGNKSDDLLKEIKDDLLSFG
jgi:hypothetical protein